MNINFPLLLQILVVIRIHLKQSARFLSVMTCTTHKAQGKGKLKKADAQPLSHLSGLLEPMQNWGRAVLEKEVELRRRAQALLALPVRMPSQAPLAYHLERNAGEMSLPRPATNIC